MHGSVERSILRAAEMHSTEFIDLSLLNVHPMVRGSSTPHDMSYTFASRRVTSQKERGNCRPMRTPHVASEILFQLFAPHQ